jgi:hypothetical protein
MNSKEIFRDSILFCGSTLLNLLLVFLVLKFVRNINELILSLLYENNSLDNLLLKIHTLSLSGIFFLSLCYFIYLDMKTIIINRSGVPRKNKPLFGKKEYINKAYNLYAKIPIEYPLNQTVKIYIRRLYLAFFVLLPFYMLTVIIYIFIIAPLVMSVAVLVIFLGTAFLYLYEFKVWKKLEKYISNFINKLKPDEIEG